MKQLIENYLLNYWINMKWDETNIMVLVIIFVIRYWKNVRIGKKNDSFILLTILLLYYKYKEKNNFFI